MKYEAEDIINLLLPMAACWAEHGWNDWRVKKAKKFVDELKAKKVSAKKSIEDVENEEMNEMMMVDNEILNG